MGVQRVAIAPEISDDEMREFQGDAENARHELAGHENARNAIVWNTEC